jgi:glycosyltransferase involved in cell wall biosynthesis
VILGGPLVTIGVPVYRGQDDLPITLECLQTQSYPNLDVLISVDAGDQESARASEPFLRRDPRFRMKVQSTRLGWAGNTDWTIRERRGDFYIFQQHDDQVSPTYVADLVAAGSRAPNAAICFAEMQYTGLVNAIDRGFPVFGDPIQRVLTFLKRMECAPLRGLIRSSALASTSGLLLSDSDPFESFGTETRLLAELALWGDFVFVSGPIYFKRMHGANLHLKRSNWSVDRNRRAWACLCAWMIEVIAMAGQAPMERQQLFDTVLERFLNPRNPWQLLRGPVRRLGQTSARVLHPIRVLFRNLKNSESLVRSVTGGWVLYELKDREDRSGFLQLVFDQLKRDARFDPSGLQSSWEMLEEQTYRRFGGAPGSEVFPRRTGKAS